MLTFTETFYMFIITSGIGFFLALVKSCYKSKCKEVSCCCMKIIRDVETEEKLDELTNNKSDSKDNNI